MVIGDSAALLAVAVRFTGGNICQETAGNKVISRLCVQQLCNGLTIHGQEQRFAEVHIGKNRIIGVVYVYRHILYIYAGRVKHAGILFIILKLGRIKFNIVQLACFKHLKLSPSVGDYLHYQLFNLNHILLDIFRILLKAYFGIPFPCVIGKCTGAHNLVYIGAICGCRTVGIHKGFIHFLIYGDRPGIRKVAHHLSRILRNGGGYFYCHIIHLFDAYILPRRYSAFYFGLRIVSLGIEYLYIVLRKCAAAAVNQLRVEQHFERIHKIVSCNGFSVCPAGIGRYLYLPNGAVIVHLYGLAIGYASAQGYAGLVIVIEISVQGRTGIFNTAALYI